MAWLRGNAFFQTDNNYLVQYIRGVLNNGPAPAKKAIGSWNVDIMLDYLLTVGSNFQMGINYLAGKIVVLILLTRMCRIGKVVQLDTEFMHDSRT